MSETHSIADSHADQKKSLEHTELMHYIPRLKSYTNDSKSPRRVEPDDQMNMVFSQNCPANSLLYTFFFSALDAFLINKICHRERFLHGEPKAPF